MTRILLIFRALGIADEQSTFARKHAWAPSWQIRTFFTRYIEILKRTRTVWKPDEVIAWRGIYRDCIWHALPMIVLKDSPEELILALLPGADGVVPEGYSEGKESGKRRWDFRNRDWRLDKYTWHTSRRLFVMEPEEYYTVTYVWHNDSNEFMHYYINFQLPFRRSHCGIDSLDLELDLIVSPDFTYQWKDLDDYQKAIDVGLISLEWVREIEKARHEILDRVSRRAYPFDGFWLNWKPNPSWPAATLPTGWDKI